MPTIYPIDSYQEKEIGVWLNNKPLYQTDIKINTDLSESPAFFDTENIFNQLDYLTNIEGISFSSESNKYITYSDKTYDATLSYDRETHYIKLDFIEDLGTLSNTTITFYYTKASTNRLKTSTILEQSGDYYPVMDVKVNGDSVIDGSRVAQIKSYKEVTQEEYNALPDSKKYDGIMYCIIDSTTPEDKQVIDIQLDGVSVVDRYGVANLQGLATAVDLAKKQNLLVAGSNVTLVPLSDGTVQINASGGGGSVSGVTDVIVNGSSVVTNNVAVFTVPTSVPTKTSDLFNDSGYINKEVNNLTNYYTKAQTNNKIEEEINSIPIVTNQDKGLMSPALKSLAENAIQDVKVNNISVVNENGIANIYYGGHHYSIEEQAVGTWIDGSTIYEKTWEIATPITFGSSPLTLPQNICNDLSNAKLFLDGMALRINSENVAAIKFIAIYRHSSSEIRVMYADTWSNVSAITIQYTKTTNTTHNA